MAGVDPRLDLISKSIRVVPDFPKAGIQFQDVTTILLDPEAFQATIDLLVENYRNQKIDVIAGTGRRGCQKGMAQPRRHLCNTALLRRAPRHHTHSLNGVSRLAITHLQCNAGLTFLPAGFEARGLIFGAPLALALKVPFVPLRKPGKLPGAHIHTPNACVASAHAQAASVLSSTHGSSPSRPGATVSVEYKTEYSVDKIEMHIGAITEGQRVLLVDDLIATGGTLGESALRQEWREVHAQNVNVHPDTSWMPSRIWTMLLLLHLV